MLTTTDAIVLSLQPHSDKAHVLHTYTRAGGRVNYMVYGLGRKNTAGRFSPLSVNQITADTPSAQELNGKPASLRTAQLTFVPCTITEDPYKRTIALFISEVLYHVLRHPMPDEQMFDFIRSAVERLDATDTPQNFHLCFLAEFAALLGFAIDPTNPLSALQNGTDIPFSRTERQEVLRKLCAYFAEHVETWQDPKSLDVLMEVFD